MVDCLRNFGAGASTERTGLCLEAHNGLDTGNASLSACSIFLSLDAFPQLAIMLPCGMRCCMLRRSDKVSDRAADTVQPGAMELTVPVQERILQLKPAAGELVGSKSLLEASAKRVAQSDREPKFSGDGADGDAPLEFLKLYMAALRDGNTEWASQPALSELFAEEAKLVTPDKQVFHGKEAVLRRLNKGVETLVKMAGKDAELPTYELAGPELTAAGVVQMGCTIKRGRSTLRFKMEFTLARGRIVQLRNSRG